MAVSTQAAIMRHRTAPSPNIAAASRNSVRLYRECVRSIPMIREKYQIDYTKPDITKRFREEWERNRALKDHEMVDHLVFKGWTELDEAKNLWKQRPHVMAFLKPEAHAAAKTDGASTSNKEFLKRFFTGQEIDY